MTPDKTYTFIKWVQLKGELIPLIVKFKLDGWEPVLLEQCERADTGETFLIYNWEKSFRKQAHECADRLEQNKELIHKIDMQLALGNKLFTEGTRVQV